VLSFKQGTDIKGYKLIDANGSATAPDQRLEPLGQGGSSVVYLAEQLLIEPVAIKRAIKFFMYRDDIAAFTAHLETGPVSSDDFMAEVANIARVSHQNILQVIDAGAKEFGTLRIPFIVSQFIDGPTLRDVITGASDTAKSLAIEYRQNPANIFDLLFQIASAIGHLHSKGYSHCDIAPKNIFLDLSGNIRPVLGDLGLAKSFKERLADTVLIAGSLKYMPYDALNHLNKRVRWEEFSQLQPSWDIFGFSKSAQDILSIVPDEVGGTWKQPLNHSFDDAMRGVRYRTIDELRERIEFLRPTSREYSRVPELIAGMSARRILMPAAAPALTRRMSKLSFHPAMTRLSRVAQLTVAAQRFPGAVHTRYEHALGVFETTREYLLSLIDQKEFLDHLSQEQIETALICGLLWNITRFPFSSVVAELSDLNDPALQRFSASELLPEIFAIVDRRGKTIPSIVGEYFPYVDFGRVTALLNSSRKDLTDQDEFVLSLFNCSLDARVVDFVRRDSLHLGIVQGEAFDLRELLPHLTIVDHKLALRGTGVTVAEQVVALRYWLFNRVYWNRPNRAFVAMLKALLKGLLECSNIAADLRSSCLNASDEEFFSRIISKALGSSVQELQNLGALLVPGTQRLYKEALDVSSIEDGRLSKAISEIGKLDFRGREELAVGISEVISAMLETLPKNNKGIPVLIDVPRERGARKLGEDIVVVGATMESRTLSQSSGIVEGINKSFDEHLCRLRVFVHPAMFPPRPDAVKEVEKAIRAFLIKLF
jgi:HD superfamily phosphohydrolase